MSTIVCHNNVDLLSIIDSGASIKLKSGDYDISDIILPYDENVYYADDDVGPYGDRELILRNLREIKIHGDSGTRIISKYQYANVFTFVNCEDIEISDIEFGHYPEMGGCRGGVLVFINCKNVRIENCVFFGCGTIGITAIGCELITVMKCCITKCNSEIIHFEDCKRITLFQTELIRNETRTIKLLHSDEVYFDQCIIRENELSQWDGYDGILFVVRNSCGKIVLSNSQVDIPDNCLVNDPNRLETTNNTITDDYIYG